MQPNRREAQRKAIRTLTVSNLTIVDPFLVIAKKGELCEASSTGFKITINRKDLIPDELRQNLTIESIEAKPVMLILEEMDLELEGHITRTKLVSGGFYEICIDYSQDAPEYWRECLVDLLPGSDECWD
jgi:hypothetical protein